MVMGVHPRVKVKAWVTNNIITAGENACFGGVTFATHIVIRIEYDPLLMGKSPGAPQPFIKR
jgi:hypothetical protein